ncbi:MAG: FtsW/RodA/SpoVE family cell cycle protein [Clostridia bacterium]|nr:FtsW/RodA/SpoVE family cell cycle protein [Clostridia bacterium]
MKALKSIKNPIHPLILLILFDVLGFLLLYFRKTPYDINVLIIGGGLAVSTLLIYILTSKLRLGDRFIFLIVAMLFSIGELVLYRLDSAQGLKQAEWFGISLVFYFAAYFIFGFVHFWNKLLLFLPALSVLLFVLTYVFGTEVNGSKNWIFIKGFSIQTSEISKLIFVFFVACYYSNREKITARIPKVWATLGFLGIAYMMMGLMVLQKEWGTPLLLFLVFTLMVYIFENDLKIFLLNAAAAVAAGAFGTLFVYHIQVRVEAWLNPWRDIAGKGYQIAQSLFAIGSGDFFGSGIGLGRPDLIPDVKTDFIFSAICEEMGMFGGAAVILLFLLLAYRGFKIALKCSDLFNKTVALGITLMFAFQSFIIIAGVIKLFLLTGITLPFISYGGSSMLINLVALGVLQRIAASGNDPGPHPGESGKDVKP